MKKWHEKHPHYSTEYARKWRMRNREKIAEANRVLKMMKDLNPSELAEVKTHIEDLSKKEAAIE